MPGLAKSPPTPDLLAQPAATRLGHFVFTRLSFRALLVIFTEKGNAGKQFHTMRCESG